MRKFSILVATLLLSANIYCQEDRLIFFEPDSKDSIMFVHPIFIEPLDPQIGYIDSSRVFPDQVDIANVNKNIIYWSVNPAQRSLIGVRYDRTFKMFGMYASFSRLKHTGGDDIINYQHRYVIGGLCKLTYRKDEIDSPLASLGLVYHDWQTTDYVPGQINPDRAFRKFSIEAGWGGRIGRFNIGARLDSQIEFCVDLGLNF